MTSPIDRAWACGISAVLAAFLLAGGLAFPAGATTLEQEVQERAARRALGEVEARPSADGGTGPLPANRPVPTVNGQTDDDLVEDPFKVDPGMALCMLDRIKQAGAPTPAPCRPQ